jgi:hypothetical protein
MIYGHVINLQNFGIDQNYVQRYIVAKSDREARKSVWLGGLLYVPVSFCFSSSERALFTFLQNAHGRIESPENPIGCTGLSSEGITSESTDYDNILNARRESLTDAKIGDKVFPTLSEPSCLGTYRASHCRHLCGRHEHDGLLSERLGDTAADGFLKLLFPPERR